MSSPTRRDRVPRIRRAGPAHRARRRRAEWDDKRGTDQIDDLVERRALTASARYAPTSVKIFQDGIIENGTAGLLEPYVGPDGRPTTEPRPEPHRAGGLRRPVTRLDALGFQVHVHAIGDRAVREALDAVAAARRANGHDRHAPAHRAHPGDPSRRHRTVPRARRGRQCAAVLGLSRGPDGRPHDPALGAGAGRPAIPVRIAARARARPSRWAPTGRLDRRPAARDGGRRRPASAIAPRRAAALPPGRADRADRGARRVHRSGPPGSTTSRPRSGSLEVGKAGGPGRPRPRPVRPRRRARSAKRGSSRRSSTASPSTRLRRSRADARPAGDGRMTMSNSTPDVGGCRAPPERCS